MLGGTGQLPYNSNPSDLLFDIGMIADPKQSWIGKPRFLLDGVIYKYDVGNAEQESWTRAKQVPADRIVAHIEGAWMKQIKYRMKGEKVCLQFYSY